MEQARSHAVAYRMGFNPIVLKDLALDCGISQVEIAAVLAVSRPTANLILNRGYLPKEHPCPKETVERMIRTSPKCMKWLAERGMTETDVWKPSGKDLRNKVPWGSIRKGFLTRQQWAMVPGDPEQIIRNGEVEMISQEAMKHFKIFRNPFIDDIQKDTDIYMSEDHRYIEAAMLDAARHGGFLAVIGEVGSGKSVIRRKVIEQLKKDADVIVIFPQMIDKTRVNAASICDAIVMDLSDERPKMKQEDKTRQVHKLLLDRANQGLRSVLILEEAHDLHKNTLKYLKRFLELEHGYRKLLGIILVGQTELKETFNEQAHGDMREVIQRIQTAEIQGLNGGIKDYLALKFRRIGSKIDDIFTDDAFPALSARLKLQDRQNRVISRAYPLTVNNWVTKAMNKAHELGEAKVTAAVIMAI